MEISNWTKRLPCGALWQLRKSLSWIDRADIDGVVIIRLEEKISPATQTSPSWHKNATAEDLNVNGLYLAGQGKQGSITLFVRDLYRGIPSYLWLTPVVTLRFTTTLAHEIGHHLVFKRGYIFERNERLSPWEYEEEMANRYSFTVTQRMKKRWHYRIASKVLKYLAVWHCDQASMFWKQQDFGRAAERWYQAFNLDPDCHEAIHAYNQAKEAIRHAKKSYVVKT